MSVIYYLKIFFDDLKEYNIYGYIYGGKCLEYYLQNDINTIDYDIKIYITNAQLSNPEIFNIIYNNIIQLYKNLLSLFDLLPLQKFDYNNIYKIYLPNSLLSNEINYYNHNIITDIQIENKKYNTLIDLNITLTPNINYIISITSSNYYLILSEFIKQYNKYYNDLPKFTTKKNIVRERLRLLSNLL